MSRKPSAAACPCGAGAYANCCGLYHAGALPASAEKLMRSRYSAYVLGLTDYVQASWHASTRPATLQPDPGTKWLGLEIRRQSQKEDAATVEFVARYRSAGRRIAGRRIAGPAHRLHETSRFVREGGRWFYLDGDFPERKA